MSISIEPHKRNPNMSRKSADNGAELKFDPDHENGCFKCGNQADYNFEYDSNYCATCNKWLEGKCRDINCTFCPKRPKYPKYSD